MSENNGGVKISTKEIYDMVFHALREIEKIEAKIENINQLEEKCKESALDAKKALEIIKEKEASKKYIIQMIIGALITGAVTVIIYLLSGGKIA